MCRIPPGGPLLLIFLSCITSTSAGFFRYKWPEKSETAESITERLKKCDELKEALKTFFDDYILEQVGVDDKEYLRTQITEITGVDFNSNRQLTRLACKLTGVKNLQQLARTLKLPLAVVVKYYNLFKDMVREHGGPEGMARLVDLWEVTVPAAKQVGLPHWPINCSYELAYDFFQHVVHDFGKDFIMDFLRPYATQTLELNNIGTFVKDLLAATSIEDFAIRVGLNPDIVQFFQKDLEIYTSDNYPFEKTMKQARAEVILARALDKLGLLDLKLRRKSKSKPRKPSVYYYPKYDSYGSVSTELGNNRYDDYPRDRNYLEGYGSDVNTNRNYYTNLNPYFDRQTVNDNYYRNRNKGYNSMKYGSNRSNKDFYSGSQNDYDYYTSKYGKSRYGDLPYMENTRQSQERYKGRMPSKEQNSPFGEYRDEQGRKLIQVADDETAFDDTSGDRAEDRNNEYKAKVPKYITYKWNTKPKEKPKSPYMYYG